MEVELVKVAVAPLEEPTGSDKGLAVTEWQSVVGRGKLRQT